MKVNFLPLLYTFQAGLPALRESTGKCQLADSRMETARGEQSGVNSLCRSTLAAKEKDWWTL